MTIIKFKGACASAFSNEAITVGAVGLKVQFEFDKAWNGLNKTAVFNCGGVTKDVLGSSFPDGICEIPHECLMHAGEILYCGVYGTDADGKVIIPSKMARIGIVYAGADPSGDESTAVTLPVWAQIQGDVTDIDTRVTDIDTRVTAVETELSDTVRTVNGKNPNEAGDVTIDTDEIFLSPNSAHYVESDTVTEILDNLTNELIKKTEVLVVNLSADSNGNIVGDKSFAEIYAAAPNVIVTDGANYYRVDTATDFLIEFRSEASIGETSAGYQSVIVTSDNSWTHSDNQVQYALANDLTSLTARVEALEAKLKTNGII